MAKNKAEQGTVSASLTLIVHFHKEVIKSTYSIKKTLKKPFHCIKICVDFLRILKNKDLIISEL